MSNSLAEDFNACYVGVVMALQVHFCQPEEGFDHVSLRSPDHTWCVWFGVFLVLVLLPLVLLPPPATMFPRRLERSSFI